MIDMAIIIGEICGIIILCVLIGRLIVGALKKRSVDYYDYRGKR